MLSSLLSSWVDHISQSRALMEFAWSKTITTCLVVMVSKAWKLHSLLESDAMCMMPGKLQSLLNERNAIVVVGSPVSMPFTPERLEILMKGDVRGTGESLSCLGYFC